MPNATIYTANSTNSMFYRSRVSGTTWYNLCDVGVTTGADGTYDGGLRFTGIALSQGATINYARLGFWIDWRAGTTTIPIKIEGIDEDNTDPFTSAYSNPFGRSRTAASTTASCDGGIAAGVYWKAFDLTGIINEIVGRGSWSSGNAMGFVLTDNGSTGGTDSRIYDALTGTNSYLAIRQAALPDTTPTSTNKDVYHGNIKENRGLKASETGKDTTKVGTGDQVFTSRLPTTQGFIPGRIQNFGKTNSTITVKHGLGYVPKVIAYMKDESNQSFMLPHSFTAAFKEAFIANFTVDSENIVFTASAYVQGETPNEDYVIDYFIVGENTSIL